VEGARRHRGSLCLRCAASACLPFACCCSLSFTDRHRGSRKQRNTHKWRGQQTCNGVSLARHCRRAVPLHSPVPLTRWQSDPRARACCSVSLSAPVVMHVCVSTVAACATAV
jgi:hypothetical protein